jgi:hypothetical protein
MKDPVKLKELLIEKINLADVMIEYNVEFPYDPRLVAEVQFKCPIHGKDNKPSARLYNDTKSCYCWVCRKSWDVVSFIQDMEKFSFGQTLNYIIKKYKIDTSSILDTPELDLESNEISINDPLIKKAKIKKMILELKKTIPYKSYCSLCTAYFMSDFAIAKGANPVETLNKIEEKLCQYKN